MGLFRKTPEEIEEKRKKNFEKQMRKFEELLEKTWDETPNASRVIFYSNIGMLAIKTKTKDEYQVCAPLLKEWFEFMVRILKINKSEISFKNSLSWASVI